MLPLAAAADHSRLIAINRSSSLVVLMLGTVVQADRVSTLTAAVTIRWRGLNICWLPCMDLTTET